MSKETENFKEWLNTPDEAAFAAPHGSAIHGATYQELNESNAALLAENANLQDKLTEDRARLTFIRSKAKYAPPVKGMFGGAWQITLTVGPGHSIAPDFFDALDRAKQSPNAKLTP